MAVRILKKHHHGVTMCFVSAAFVALTGCAGNQSMSKGSTGDNSRLIKEFNCTDRNGNDYIDKAELVYLAECGVVHESLSDQKAAEMSEKSAFENGRRFLETMDANDDDQISLLEFRAHFNATN